MSNNLEVAMAKQLCPLCLSEHHVIIMNEKLTKKAAKQIKEAQNTVIGFTDEPCTECQSKLKDGFIAMIGIDPDKSNSADGLVIFRDIYRTGQFGWIKKEAAKEMFNWDRTEPFILLEEAAILSLKEQLDSVNE